MRTAMQLLLWGKAGCEYPDFLVGVGGWAIHDSGNFETNTRESVTINNLAPIGCV